MAHKLFAPTKALLIAALCSLFWQGFNRESLATPSQPDQAPSTQEDLDVSTPVGVNMAIPVEATLEHDIAIRVTQRGLDFIQRAVHWYLLGWVRRDQMAVQAPVTLSAVLNKVMMGRKMGGIAEDILGQDIPWCLYMNNNNDDNQDGHVCTCSERQNSYRGDWQNDDCAYCEPGGNNNELPDAPWKWVNNTQNPDVVGCSASASTGLRLAKFYDPFDSNEQQESYWCKGPLYDVTFAYNNIYADPDCFRKYPDQMDDPNNDPCPDLGTGQTCHKEDQNAASWCSPGLSFYNGDRLNDLTVSLTISGNNNEKKIVLNIDLENVTLDGWANIKNNFSIYEPECCLWGAKKGGASYAPYGATVSSILSPIQLSLQASIYLANAYEDLENRRPIPLTPIDPKGTCTTTPPIPVENLPQYLNEESNLVSLALTVSDIDVENEDDLYLFVNDTTIYPQWLEDAGWSRNSLQDLCRPGPNTHEADCYNAFNVAEDWNDKIMNAAILGVEVTLKNSLNSKIFPELVEKIGFPLDLNLLLAGQPSLAKHFCNMRRPGGPPGQNCRVGVEDDTIETQGSCACDDLDLDNVLNYADACWLDPNGSKYGDCYDPFATTAPPGGWEGNISWIEWHSSPSEINLPDVLQPYQNGAWEGVWPEESAKAGERYLSSFYGIGNVDDPEKTPYQAGLYATQRGNAFGWDILLSLKMNPFKDDVSVFEGWEDTYHQRTCFPPELLNNLSNIGPNTTLYSDPGELNYYWNDWDDYGPEVWDGNSYEVQPPPGGQNHFMLAISQQAIREILNQMIVSGLLCLTFTDKSGNDNILSSDPDSPFRVSNFRSILPMLGETVNGEYQWLQDGAVQVRVIPTQAPQIRILGGRSGCFPEGDWIPYTANPFFARDLKYLQPTDGCQNLNQPTLNKRGRHNYDLMVVLPNVYVEFSAPDANGIRNSLFTISTNIGAAVALEYSTENYNSGNFIGNVDRYFEILVDAFIGCGGPFSVWDNWLTAGLAPKCQITKNNYSIDPESLDTNDFAGAVPGLLHSILNTSLSLVLRTHFSLLGLELNLYKLGAGFPDDPAALDDLDTDINPNVGGATPDFFVAAGQLSGGISLIKVASKTAPSANSQATIDTKISLPQAAQAGQFIALADLPQASLSLSPRESYLAGFKDGQAVIDARIESLLPAKDPAVDIRYSVRFNDGVWQAYHHSGVVYVPPLPTGKHKLEVRARQELHTDNYLGAVDDSPAIIEFYVDQAAPDLFIKNERGEFLTSEQTIAPQVLAVTVADNISATGDIKRQYRLDDGAWQPLADQLDLSALTTGQHTLTVQAIDEFENVTTQTLTIDAAADRGCQAASGQTSWLYGLALLCLIWLWRQHQQQV